MTRLSSSNIESGDSVAGRKNWGAIRIRFLTGMALTVLVLTLVWAPHCDLLFAGFIAMLAALGYYEYCAMARAKGIAPEVPSGMVAAALLVLSGCAYQMPMGMGGNVVLYAAFLVVTCVCLLRRFRSLVGIAATLFGVFYVGWLPMHIVLLHSFPHWGAGLVTMLIAGVALSDTGAYLTGMAFGRRKMAPKLSPNKTWEGAFGGLALAAIGLAGIGMLREAFSWQAFPDYALWMYAAIGAILSVAGQIGDLTESALKRDAGVKDSGTLIPGHGGVLDRCDGFLFAAPVLWYLFLFSIWRFFPGMSASM